MSFPSCVADVPNYTQVIFKCCRISTGCYIDKYSLCHTSALFTFGLAPPHTYQQLFLFSPIPGRPVSSFLCRCQLGKMFVCVCDGGGGMVGEGCRCQSPSQSPPIVLVLQGDGRLLEFVCFMLYIRHEWFQYLCSWRLCKIHQALCVFCAPKLSGLLFHVTSVM